MSKPYSFKVIQTKTHTIHSRYCKIAVVSRTKRMIFLLVVSIITMAKSVPFSTHDTFSYKTMPETTMKINTLNITINNKTRKEQTDFSFGRKQKVYIAHYMRNARRRLRRSYQQLLDQNDTGYKNGVNRTDTNTEQTNINYNPNESSNVKKEHRITSISYLNGPTTENGMSSKSEFSQHKASTLIQDDKILIKPTRKINSKTSKIDIINQNNSESGFHGLTSSEEKASTSSLKSHTTLSPHQQNSVIPNEETSIGGIVIVSILSIILSSSIFASNLLVMIPFNRCTRIRTPSNFLLLVLSISDLVIGIVVIPLVTITTILR